MKKSFTLLLLLSTAIFASSLSIQITSLKNNKGTVRLGLFDSKASYTHKTKPYKGVEIKIKNKKASYVFKNLPKGIYALAVFHDENTNKILDKNILGIPKEGYGFSNNAKATFSAPSFEKVKFSFSKSQKFHIEMDY